MDLIPQLPPGRVTRKALAFTAEIARLRAAGYSFEAIRLALLQAGVQVSRTTVKREAAKRCVVATPAPRPHAALPATPPPASVAIAPASFAGDSRSGKEIAETFMKGHVTNPLLQGRN